MKQKIISTQKTNNIGRIYNYIRKHQCQLKEKLLAIMSDSITPSESEIALKLRYGGHKKHSIT